VYVSLLCDWVFIDLADVLLVIKQYASDDVQFGVFLLFLLDHRVLFSR
jgi:hypothetical protein